MEQKYWIHRVKCGENACPFTYELLKKHNMISIGWSYLSDAECQSKLTASRESFEKMFEGSPRNRYNLWRFLNEMKKGDIVVVPLPGVFDAYRIADDIIYNNETIDHNLWVDWNGQKAILDKDGYPAYANGQQIDMGFYRKVEPFCMDPISLEIPRGDYASQALYSRMKIQQTNADICDLRIDVDEAVARFAKKRPINLRCIFLEDAAKILLERIRVLLKDYSLESLIKWYMEQLGADAIIPPKNSTGCREGDADVIATFGKLNGFTIFIQAKKHLDYSDEWAVEQITTYKKTLEKKMQIPSSQLWVISTCDDFGKKAKHDAEASNVRLITGLEFAKMLIENGVYSLPL